MGGMDLKTINALGGSELLTVKEQTEKALDSCFSASDALEQKIFGMLRVSVGFALAAVGVLASSSHAVAYWPPISILLAGSLLSVCLLSRAARTKEYPLSGSIWRDYDRHPARHSGEGKERRLRYLTEVNLWKIRKVRAINKVKSYWHDRALKVAFWTAILAAVAFAATFAYLTYSA